MGLHGLDGVDGWMDTPKNVMTTRAPAVLKIHNSKPFNSILCLDQISASAPAYNADPADSGRSLFTLHTHTGWLKGFLVPLIESAIVSTPITRQIFALCVD